MRSSPSSTKHNARTPSHFTSKNQSSPPGGVLTRHALIGSNHSGIRTLRAPFNLEGSRCALFFFGTALAWVPAASAFMTETLAPPFLAPLFLAAAEAPGSLPLLVHTASGSTALGSMTCTLPARRVVLRAGRLCAISSWLR